MSEQPLELVGRFFEATDRHSQVLDNPRSIAEALESDELDPAGEEAFSLRKEVIWRAANLGCTAGTWRWHGHGTTS